MVQLYIHRQRTSARVPGAALLGVWLAGSSLGLWAARFYGDAYGPLVLQAGETELSFVSACVVTLLPLLLSAFAVFFFHRPGVYGACLLRSISLGFFLGVFSAVGGLWLAVWPIPTSESDLNITDADKQDHKNLPYRCSPSGWGCL